MIKQFKLHAAAAGVALALGVASGPAAAVSVGLELMLLVDVSGSVDTNEYNLQKQGYVSAFNSATVQNAILGSQGGAIAVTYIEWSSNGVQSQQVGWTLINSAASAQAFAAAINATTRSSNGSTAIQDAMRSQYIKFGTEVGGTSNGFESVRQVIDVSGDGADNNTTSCNTTTNPACGRDAALAAGVDAINGLPILGESGLLAYYTNNVKGGALGFVDPVSTFAEFGQAIEAKLTKEITQVPEPGTMLLLGASLLGFGFARRRKV